MTPSRPAPAEPDLLSLTATEDRIGRLQLGHVSKTFTSRGAPVVAVDDVDLDIAPGEFITLLGPSGCGKTTTLRIVAGFESASGGHVRLDGRLLDDVAPQRRGMSMVFQSYALFPHLTVAENITYGLRLLRLSRDEITTRMKIAVTSMNLVGLEHRHPHELSGGQQQRVALARALVVQPKVLLFDEPLSNLDAKLRGAMRSEIRRIQGLLGITSLYVTHDQDEAMSMSDRIVVMNKGRIEQVGTPAEVYFRPATVFVADFIGRANFIGVVPDAVSDGQAAVSGLGQRLSVAAHPDVRAGAPAHLVVRPETIALQPTSQSGSGTILRTTFHGQTVDYEVETRSGTLSVTVPGPDPTGFLAVGTHVDVQIDPRRAYVLARE